MSSSGEKGLVRVYRAPGTETFLGVRNSVLLRSNFECVRNTVKVSLIYALHYHTLDDLKANTKYNKMNGLLLTRLIETLIPIG